MINVQIKYRHIQVVTFTSSHKALLFILKGMKGMDAEYLLIYVSSMIIWSLYIPHIH